MLQRYRIKPLAPLITPLMSDTIFGHFCWFLRHHDGEEFLQRFLARYEKGVSVPVLFSSALPSCYLPRPTLPPPCREDIKAFVKRNFGESKSSQFDGFSKVKSWNKRMIITLHDWQLLKHDYDDEKLYELWLERDKGKEDNQENAEQVTELSSHNFISRETGTVPAEGGGLFMREKIWYRDGLLFDLYTCVNDQAMTASVNEFLLSYLPETGFGADKSTGMGAMSITRDEQFTEGDFHMASANARMALSLTAFPEMGSYPAYYRLKTKFGKLGGEFAVTSPTGGDTRPFKKPILMYEEGAVFIGGESLETTSLLSQVHSDERIRHCGIPITLPLKIREDFCHVRDTAA